MWDVERVRARETSILLPTRSVFGQSNVHGFVARSGRAEGTCERDAVVHVPEKLATCTSRKDTTTKLTMNYVSQSGF